MQHVRTGRGADGAAALDVAAVSHSYGPKRALNDVSFSIAPATFTVLLGLNGAGKTTLFSLISHLYDTRHGSIRIFGHDIGRAPGEALQAARHRVPGAHARPRSQRLPEPFLPCLAARPRLGRSAAAHRCAAGAGRDERPPARQGAQPVRRADAAHRDRPRAAAPPAAPAARRGDRRPRRPVARGHPRQLSAGWSRPKASASSGRPI